MITLLVEIVSSKDTIESFDAIGRKRSIVCDLFEFSDRVKASVNDDFDMDRDLR